MIPGATNPTMNAPTIVSSARGSIYGITLPWSRRRPRGGRSTPEAEEDVDLGLSALQKFQLPGQTLTLKEIAEVTGLSHGGVAFLQKSGERKLRKHFGRQGIGRLIDLLDAMT